MKNLQFNYYQCGVGVWRGWGGAGQIGSKKSKAIPTPPRGVGLESHPIPTPPPLQGGENLCGAKQGGRLSEVGRNCHP